MPAKPLLVDTDIHPNADSQRIMDFLPEPWRTRYAGGNRSATSLGWWNPNGVNRPDAVTEDGARLEGDPHLLARFFLDEYGIDYAVLITGGTLHLGLSPEADYAASVISATNDVMIHDWLPADERYRYALAIYPNDPELAVREIHRHGDHPGVVQVQMPSASRIPYGQRFFHPIYEAAAAHNLPVAIHPGAEGVGLSGPPTAVGYPTSYLEWHTGLVASYIAHVTSLITEGVFQKFPTLKFILVEGGISWLPPILWRLDKNWKALRVMAPWVDRLPSEIVRDHILLTTQPVEEPEDLRHFHAILEMFDAEKMLMFSSDFPHWDGDAPDFAARQFPAALRARVMGETAKELYSLPEPAQRVSTTLAY
jgi:uncharacterized protein